MGVINTSKDQALIVTDSSKVQAKGKSKKKEPKVAYSNPKQNQQTFEGASGSKKKKKSDKKLCPYCENGYHLEDHCMKKHIDLMPFLLKKHNISLPQGAKKPDEEPKTEDTEIPRGVML